jgi:hypothetical protein
LRILRQVDDIESKNASLQQQIVTLQGQLAQVKGQRPRARQQNNKSQQHFFAATLVARHLLKEKERVQMDIEYLRWARDATLTRAFDFFSRSLDADPVRTAFPCSLRFLVMLIASYVCTIFFMNTRILILAEYLT